MNIIKTTSRIIRAFSIKRFNNKRYWSKRVKKFGSRAVINLDYSRELLDEVTQRDIDETFPYLKEFVKKTDNSLLDLGCGAGRFTIELSKLVNGKTIGLDITSKLIAMAPKAENVEFRVMNEGTIPLADKSIDVIWTYGVLGCMSEDILINTIAEIRRVLRPDGLLFFVENTTEITPKDYYYYRQVEDYQRLFNHFVMLRHIHDYYDIHENMKERFSIISGRISA